MSLIHTVKQGECLSLIAKKYNFASWRILYDHPENAKLKTKRPNPNILYPGDQIVIPDKAVGHENATTDGHHKFQLKTIPRRLKLVLLDNEGTAFPNARYRLTIGEHVFEAVTDAKGIVNQALPADAEEAQ